MQVVVQTKQEKEPPPQPRRRTSTTLQPHQTPESQRSKHRTGREQRPIAGVPACGCAGAPDQPNPSYRQSGTKRCSTSASVGYFRQPDVIDPKFASNQRSCRLAENL